VFAARQSGEMAEEDQDQSFGMEVRKPSRRAVETLELTVGSYASGE
jgi:hypothetical protein